MTIQPNESNDPNLATILSLHEDIMSCARKSVESAIRIGGLLSERKEAMAHGTWSNWLEVHIPFSERTTRNYMRLYRHRDRIKSANIADLTEAYALMSQPESLPSAELAQAAKAITTTLAALIKCTCTYCFEVADIRRQMIERPAAFTFEQLLATQGVSLEEFERNLQLAEQLMSGDFEIFSTAYTPLLAEYIETGKWPFTFAMRPEDHVPIPADLLPR